MYLWKDGKKGRGRKEDRRKRGGEGGTEGVWWRRGWGLHHPYAGTAQGVQNSGVGERPETTTQGPTAFQGRVRKGKPSAENDNHSSEREEEPHSQAGGLHLQKGVGYPLLPPHRLTNA